MKRLSQSHVQPPWSPTLGGWKNGIGVHLQTPPAGVLSCTCRVIPAEAGLQNVTHLYQRSSFNPLGPSFMGDQEEDSGTPRTPAASCCTVVTSA